MADIKGSIRNEAEAAAIENDVLVTTSVKLVNLKRPNEEATVKISLNKEKPKRKCKCLSPYVDRLIIKPCVMVVNKSFINKCLIFSLIMGSIWVLLYLLSGKESLPGGIWWNIYILFTLGHILSTILALVKLPTLLGII